MNKNRSISLILLIAVYIILFIAVIALLHEQNLQIKLINSINYKFNFHNFF